MTIDDSKKNISQSILSTLTKGTTKSSDTANPFADILEDHLKTKIDLTGNSTTSSTETTEQDAAIAAFKEALSSKGALQFYQDYNNEKIEKMIEAKKAELTEKLGLGDDAQPPLVGQDRENALASLDQMMSDYRKELMEKLSANNEQSKTNEILSTFLQELS